MSFIFFVVLTALLLDRIFAEVEQGHPLVSFGNFALSVEQRSNANDQGDIKAGIKAWCLVIIPVVLAFYLLDKLLSAWLVAEFILSATVLYFAIGRQSLLQHASAIIKPLQELELAKRRGRHSCADESVLLDDARHQVSMIVSRDCSKLDTDEVIAAGTESVLENGADAIFAAIFWFCVAGVPGVVLYRLSNTLDAMWGYKNERFLLFGRFAARFDDVMNFIPARLTAVSYCLLAPVVQGSMATAYRCWQSQAADWKSPNAGPVMAAGAGALQVSLGGTASYNNQVQFRPVLGVSQEKGRPLSAATLLCACRLINATTLLWLAAIFIFV